MCGKHVSVFCLECGIIIVSYFFVFAIVQRSVKLKIGNKNSYGKLSFVR